eukprot:748421-Hanusia_phi.AAC.7
MIRRIEFVQHLFCLLVLLSYVRTDQGIEESWSWSEEDIAVVEQCRQDMVSLEEKMRIADSFTQQGNEFSLQGMHHRAIVKWEIATRCHNESNVPWNNMANSFLTLGNLSAATAAAEISFSIRADHMSSTTLGNAYRAHKMYERAEKTFLAGVKYCLDNSDRHEHPFWSLAMLYWDQGDYIEFLRYAKLGLDHISRVECVESTEEEGACQVPDFEIDLMRRVYEASMDLGLFVAGHGMYEEARSHLEWAEFVAETYPAEGLNLSHASWHLECVKCAVEGSKRVGPCASEVGTCRARWEDTNGRYLRMMAVRAMGCEWRHREQDVRDLEKIMQSPNMTALLNHTTEFYFECEKGRVCGAGAQPPLHMWGLPMSLESVLIMGKVQPLQLVDRMLVDGPPPQWAYPTWSPNIGTVLRIGLVSSDLLRDHPVGNMMRHVLHLHDLSRMDVTVFLIHESQRFAASRVENENVLGEVKFRMIGRGPHVTRFWDAKESVEGADIVNTAGICILFDLIGYTADHRQDIFALRPAPVQVHYHGYMGSTGAPWIQYYVADRCCTLLPAHPPLPSSSSLTFPVLGIRWIAPPEHANFFSEKLALMPECFLGPSHRLSFQVSRIVAAPTMTVYT